ncbi:MAG: trigger factor [bacterium]|nr:trigger factor [bacterium]
MNFTTHALPRSRIEVRAEEPYEKLEPFLQKAAKAISEEIEIPGFRKGMAPYEKIRDAVGEFKILEEAARLLIRKQYSEIMRELEGKHEFIGSPDIAITKLAKGDALTYTITLSLIPALELPDYKKIASRIAKNKKSIAIENKEIEDALKWLQESRATLITVTRPTETGDRVEIDFTARHDKVKLEGGESKNHPLTIGEGTFIPGFEEELVGLTTSEEKSFSLVVPQDYHDKNLAGKELEFSVAMKLVQERKLPELTDDFARSIGNFESVTELEKNIREGITQEKEMKERDRIRMEIANAIAKEIHAEMPDVLIATELEKMREELMRSITRMGLKWDEYLTHIKKSEDDLKREWADDAEKRVTIALALREIAKRESIVPGAEEIQEAADRWVAQSGLMGEELKKIDKEGLKQYALGVVRNEKTFEFLETL